MRKTFSYFILILPVIWIYSQGCRKERKPYVYKVDQYLKDWMFFDTGSCWLYKEMNTGAIDSQYVIQSKLVNITNENRKNAPYYTDEYSYVNLNRNFSFIINSPKGSSLIQKIEQQSSEEGTTFLLFKPLLLGQRKAASGLGYTEIKQIDPHFTLDNVKYDTLITLLDNLDLSEQGDSIEYKVFKGVGIISKKNITKNQDWQLVKYHIRMNKE